MNKQLLFMLTATLVGTVGTLVYEPFLGVAVYYLFGVLRPQAMWMWVLPPGISWSYYVAAATMIGVLLKFRFGGVSHIHWIVLTFGAWIVVAYLTAQNRDAASWCFGEYLKIFVMFAVSAVLIHTVRQVWTLCIIAALCLSYIAYEINYQYFVNHYLGILFNGYGGLDNNGAGLMLAMGVPLCYFAWEGTQKWWRWGFLLLILVLVHAVVMTYSRGAMVSLLATAPLFFLRSRNRRWLFAFALVGAMLVPVIAGKEIRARFFTLKDNDVDASANSRRKSWAAAWAMAKDYPVFGVGLRNSNLLSYRYHADKEGRTIHSQYLQIAADTGFVGLGLYLTIWGSLWLGLRQVRRRAAMRNDEEGRLAYAAASGVELSLLVFAVGAAFLSLEVFELPYLLFLLGAQLNGLTRSWVQSETPQVAQVGWPMTSGSVPATSQGVLA